MNDANLDPASFWEQRYGEADRVWSGRVNAALAAVAGDLQPGRSLDLGCGEGGDVLWLAARGWEATGIDLSPTAVGRAEAEAESRGLKATFVAADLTDWVGKPAAVDGSDRPFDLVSASFLQSPTQLPRREVLRAAAARVAPGGRLVIVAHAAPPSWAKADEHAHHGPSSFPTPTTELADLALDAASWRVEIAEIRERSAAGPNGEHGSHFDSVIVCKNSVVLPEETPM